MALNNIIDKYNKKRGGNTFYLPQDEDLQQQAQSSPIIDTPTAKDVKPEESTENTAPINNVAQASSSAMPEVKYPNKPQSLSDSDYEHLLRYNSPEQISTLYAPYDPSKNEGFLSRMYQSTVPAPTAPDKKQVKNARLISGISDGLGMLAQMYSAGKGAYMKERDYNQSAMAKTEGLAKEQENRYLQLMQRYNDGLFNARVKDFVQGLEDYKNGRKGIQSVLAEKQKVDQRARELQQKQAQWQYEQAQKAEQERVLAGQKDRDFEEKQRSNKANESIRRSSVDVARQRAASTSAKDQAYIKHYSSGGAKAGKTVPLYFKDGTEINIPENVWKGNYPVLVDILTEQGVSIPREWTRNGKTPSVGQLEYFIKQNKDKLPEQVKTWLKEISQLKSAEYNPTIEDEEGWDWMD